MEAIYKALEFLIDKGMVTCFVRKKYADEHYMVITWNRTDHIIRFESESEIFEYIEDTFGIEFLSNVSGDIIGYNMRK